MEKEQSKILQSLNRLSHRQLKDIKQNCNHVLHHSKNQKNVGENTMYGLSTAIESIERNLKRLKEVQEQSEKEYRENVLGIKY